MDKIQYQKAVESKEVLYLIVFKDVFKRIASMENKVLVKTTIE